ncbi:CRISPR-associated protein Cas4 [Paraflavitalea speifideaquila]|uniref:CRISPR-associated protein Cas4 n=1 Tax=Paraflavitalea speifideaquila TaxID=3076558 RepID=UPI0028E9ACD9|nr:CRISPR-associated protein Cas4 [Paraflavitalea speifideiaquila]
MTINATLINLYHVCPREMWLHAHGIRMEHTSDTVYDGKLLHEMSYPQRAEKHTEIELSAVLPDGTPLSGKIDFYDAKDKIIHETKRSNKVEEAHEWQVKYYIWLLELNGITDAHAILEYPKLRQTDEVWLGQADRSYLQEIVPAIKLLLKNDACPQRIDAKICKSCSYYDLCYVGE